MPAARPARAQTPQAFVERMQGLAQTTLQALDEMLAAVNTASLDKALADRLKGQLTNARRAIATQRDLRAPQVARTKRNREIEAQFEAEQQHKIRVEQ